MSVNSVLALDLDGVINRFCCDAGGHVGPFAIPDCIARLDRIIVEADCDVVISSSWRSIVHHRYMTVMGFRILLDTHGLRERGRIVDVTPDGPLGDRGAQIRTWWRLHPEYERLVALDDMDLGHTDAGIALVQTDGRVGLTDQDADRCIAMLKGADHE